ncbi:MAG: sensor histidine kinase, partial [Flavobacteriia bacterium]
LVMDLIDLLYIVFQREKNFGMMLSATEKASRIVRALKVYIHNPSESSVENIDLYDSISSVLFIYSSLMKEEVEVKLDVPELPKVSGYKDQLSLVWTNLIMNALQAMEFKGTIEIKAAKLDKFIRVSIRDTGPGIDPSVQDMILKDIVTTKSSGEGTGIGLSLVKKMIESQLGRIWFESEPGKGTTFFVELPVSSEK